MQRNRSHLQLVPVTEDPGYSSISPKNIAKMILTLRDMCLISGQMEMYESLKAASEEITSIANSKKK